MATLATPATLTSTQKSRRVLYPHAQWYFFAAMVITWLGFAHSYFAVGRTEPLLHHIHGALMGGWIALLILQPILYQRGNLRLHRTLSHKSPPTPPEVPPQNVRTITPQIDILKLRIEPQKPHRSPTDTTPARKLLIPEILHATPLFAIFCRPRPLASY